MSYRGLYRARIETRPGARRELCAVSIARFINRASIETSYPQIAYSDRTRPLTPRCSGHRSHILDRLIHNAYRLTIDGESMRKKHAVDPIGPVGVTSFYPRRYAPPPPPRPNGCGQGGRIIVESVAEGHGIRMVCTGFGALLTQLKLEDSPLTAKISHSFARPVKPKKPSKCAAPARHRAAPARENGQTCSTRSALQDPSGSLQADNKHPPEGSASPPSPSAPTPRGVFSGGEEGVTPDCGNDDDHSVLKESWL